MRYTFFLVAIVVLLLPVGAMAQQQDTIPPSTLHAPTNWDERLFLEINNLRNQVKGLDGPAVFLSNTAFYGVTLIPAAVYGYGVATKNTHLSYAGASTLLSVVASSLITQGLKQVFQRQRPYCVIQGWCTVDTQALPTDYSFPSGHATATAALSSGLFFHYPQWYIVVPTALYAIAVSLSRPYLAAHFPSDIMVGAMIGVATSYFFWKVEKHLFAHAGSALNPGGPPMEASPLDDPSLVGFSFGLPIP